MKTKDSQKTKKLAFGRNLERFSNKGLHPQLFIRNPALLKKTLYTIQQQQQQHAVTQVKRNTFEQLYDKIKALGEPTAKPTDKPGTTVKASKAKLKKNIKGLNWELALKTELTSKVPCVLYLETWEKNKAKEELLGPTKYTIQQAPKPYQTSGILHSKEPRFHSALYKPNSNPGPGNYGVQGIPGGRLGDAARKDICRSRKKTLMANQPRKPFQSGMGNYLAPNVYFRGIAPLTISDFLRRKISQRGPYDLFSGDRAARNRTGWLPQTEVFDAESQQLNMESTSVRISNQGTIKMVHTDKNSKPTGRFVCESTAHSWAPKTDIHFYDPKPIEVKHSFNVKDIPFNGSCRRFDSLSTRRFFKDWAVCGPGRYDIKSTLGKQATCRPAAVDSGKDKLYHKAKPTSRKKKK